MPSKCSLLLQILILDEADRVLDSAFKGQLDPIISQLPKHRQTLLFSATQTKKVKDLARLSLRDPEYISVHAEAVTATPTSLMQTVMIVPVEKKLDMLWSFIKTHLNSRILVFLSTKKQVILYYLSSSLNNLHGDSVFTFILPLSSILRLTNGSQSWQVKFVHEAFNKLRPGIPLKSLHGKMSQEKRMGVYSQFIERQSVLFCTDVLARGLDFDKAVDWVVQVDCPEDVASYIHRVGRTARFYTQGKSLLFLTPSEEKMIEKLQEAKVPIKLIKANNQKLQEVSRLLAALLVKYPDLQGVAQRAFITYLRSIHKRRDKEIFDVSKLSIENFSASLGLPMTPRIRFTNLKTKKKGVYESSIAMEIENAQEYEAPLVVKKDLLGEDLEEEDFALKPRKEGKVVEKSTKEEEVLIPGNRVLKNKKLKINLHRPFGSRVVLDEEGNSLAPLASVAAEAGTEVALDEERMNDYYKKVGAEMRKADIEDKKVDKERRREKRMKQKIKRKRGAMEDEEEEEEEDHDGSGSSDDETGRNSKRAKKIVSDNEENGGKINTDSLSVADLEEMALKFITQ
jgi:ATP-dependent RNA helicase DDX10/DBP4